MGLIKVNANTYAGEAVIQQAINAAKAAVPTSSPRAANIVRDAQGKVVSVEIQLPDVGTTGTANAAAKILANSGVATIARSSSPVVSDADLPAIGTAVTTLADGLISVTASGTDSLTVTGDAAVGTKALLGTLSATPSGTPTIEIALDAAAAGAPAGVWSYTLEFYLKRSGTSAGHCVIYWNVYNQETYGDQFGGNTFTNGNGVWGLYTSAGDAVALNNSNPQIKVKLQYVSGLGSMYVDDVLVHSSSASFARALQPGELWSKIQLLNLSSSQLTESIIIDEIKWTLTDPA